MDGLLFFVFCLFVVFFCSGRRGDSHNMKYLTLRRRKGYGSAFATIIVQQ